MIETIPFKEIRTKLEDRGWYLDNQEVWVRGEDIDSIIFLKDGVPNNIALYGSLERPFNDPELLNLDTEEDLEIVGIEYNPSDSLWYGNPNYITSSYGIALPVYIDSIEDCTKDYSTIKVLSEGFECLDRFLDIAEKGLESSASYFEAVARGMKKILTFKSVFESYGFVKQYRQLFTLDDSEDSIPCFGFEDVERGECILFYVEPFAFRLRSYTQGFSWIKDFHEVCPGVFDYMMEEYVNKHPFIEYGNQ